MKKTGSLHAKRGSRRSEPTPSTGTYMPMMTQAEAARATGRQEATISKYVNAGTVSAGKLDGQPLSKVFLSHIKHLRHRGSTQEVAEWEHMIQLVVRNYGGQLIFTSNEVRNYIGSLARRGRPPEGA